MMDENVGDERQLIPMGAMESAWETSWHWEGNSSWMVS